MTEPQKPQPVAITPEQDSRLDQLDAEYHRLKAIANEAEERFKAVTTSLKAELQAAAPGNKKVILHGRHGNKPLELTYKEGWRFDSKGLKAADPYTYARWAKRSGSWELRSSR